MYFFKELLVRFPPLFLALKGTEDLEETTTPFQTLLTKNYITLIDIEYNFVIFLHYLSMYLFDYCPYDRSGFANRKKTQKSWKTSAQSKGMFHRSAMQLHNICYSTYVNSS